MLLCFGQSFGPVPLNAALGVTMSALASHSESRRHTVCVISTCVVFVVVAFQAALADELESRALNTEPFRERLNFADDCQAWVGSLAKAVQKPPEEVLATANTSRLSSEYPRFWFEVSEMEFAVCGCIEPGCTGRGCNSALYRIVNTGAKWQLRVPEVIACDE